MKKWDVMVAFIRKINLLLEDKKSYKSLYAASVFNPFNFLPLKFCVLYLFGMSNNFWEHIIVALYSSSFLTKKLDGIPAVIVPIVDDLIPLNRVPIMDSWKNNSTEVF
jgi:hypothetical protein